MDDEYRIEHRPTKYVRGWPTPSMKPWLVFKGLRYRNAFTTKARAEKYVSEQCK